jgi:hypothetical protein
MATGDAFDRVAHGVQPCRFHRTEELERRVHPFRPTPTRVGAGVCQLACDCSQRGAHLETYIDGDETTDSFDLRHACNDAP